MSMFNPMQALRSASILGKRFTSGVTPTPSPTFMGQRFVQAPDDVDPATANRFDAGRYFDEMERIKRNSGPAVSAYKNALQTQPTREQTKPSLLRRIGGVAAGGLTGMVEGPSRGFNTARTMVDAPYDRAMTDYKNKLSGLGESAKLEQDDVDSQLKALSTARAMGLKYDEFDLKRLEAGRKNALDQGHLAVDQGNLDVNRGRAQDYGRSVTNTGAYQKGQLGVANKNAATGARNASTNATNASSLDSYRKGMLSLGQKRIDVMKDKAGKPLAPAAQQTAIDNALRLMKTDRQYKNYVTGADTSDSPIGIAEDDGSAGFAAFMRKLKTIAERQIKQGTPFGDEFDGGEDDDVVITPE